MDLIFHEKQQGQLCAQHCLNALLQGPFFTAVDLAEIAKRLDAAELQLHNATEQFGRQQSSNYDDTGFFSVQVIAKALHVWNLDLVPLNSMSMAFAKANPTTQKAFICNLNLHWFTICKLGHQWFNLNSTLARPELVSDTYLSLFLAQLQTEGYSVYAVVGDFPHRESDEYLSKHPVKLSNSDNQRGRPMEMEAGDDEELQLALRLSRELDDENDRSLRRALESSRQSSEPHFSGDDASADDWALKQALELSLQSANTSPAPASSSTRSASSARTSAPNEQSAQSPNASEVRYKRAAFLQRVATKNPDTNDEFRVVK